MIEHVYKKKAPKKGPFTNYKREKDSYSVFKRLSNEITIWRLKSLFIACN